MGKVIGFACWIGTLVGAMLVFIGVSTMGARAVQEANLAHYWVAIVALIAAALAFATIAGVLTTADKWFNRKWYSKHSAR